MPKRSDHPVDVHVGGRVRLRRMLIGLSQESLAEGLGVTFQQVQKYEKGNNRLSAGKLHQAATLMRVPIAYFFKGLGQDETVLPAHHAAQEHLLGVESLAFNRAYVRITDPRVRSALFGTIRALAGEHDEVVRQPAKPAKRRVKAPVRRRG